MAAAIPVGRNTAGLAFPCPGRLLPYHSTIPPRGML